MNGALDNTIDSHLQNLDSNDAFCMLVSIFAAYISCAAEICTNKQVITPSKEYNYFENSYVSKKEKTVESDTFCLIFLTPNL